MIQVFFKRNSFSKNSTINIYSKSFHISRISKRSRRVFISIKNLWKLEQGLGLYILSTNRGLLTDRQARFFNVGGELLCKVR
jgi:ribosomal protein S8